MALSLAACFAALHLLHMCGSEHSSDRLLHGDHHPAAYIKRHPELRLVYAPPSQASPTSRERLVLELDLYLVGCVDGFHYRVAVILRSYNDTGAMQWASWHQDLMGSDSPVMVTASFENTEGVRHICQATLLDMHPALPEEERPVAILEYAFSGLMAPDEDALLSFLAADGSSLRAIRQAQELGMSAAEVRALTVGESADMLLPPPTNTCHTVPDAGGTLNEERGEEVGRREYSDVAEEEGEEDGGADLQSRTREAEGEWKADKEKMEWEEDEWLPDEDMVEKDVIAWSGEAMNTLESLNRVGFEALWGAEAAVAPLDVDVFLLNHLPEERREWVQKVIRATGFSTIELPAVVEFEDLAALERRGLLSPHYKHYHGDVETKKRYVAHALDYRAALEAAHAHASTAWVGIFEDHLILTTSPAAASQRIRAAIRQLPPSADALYLEWCWDTCNAARFHPELPDISLPHEPFCSAAILYSKTGAAKLIQQLVPVYTSVDNMISTACKARALRCFKLRQPVFAQDLMWGSSLDPLKTRTHFHSIFRFFNADGGSLCSDIRHIQIQPSIRFVVCPAHCAVDTPMLTHPCDLDTTLQVAAQLKIASEWLGGDRLKTHAEGYFSRHPAARAL